MRRMIRSTCLLALALASGSAGALGLGQLQVRSGPGQPLIADIPVISNDPAEIANLRAELASPETFTRVGLEPPMGVVAGLRFEVDTNASGKPFIRVTSTEPVTDPALTFLVQVDWGQGRLVREYSATVNTPGSIASVSEGPVQAPVVDAPQVIERPAAVVAAPQVAVPASPPVTSQVPAPTRAPTPVAAAPRPVPASPPSRFTPVAPLPRASESSAAASVSVAAGDSLSKIAARIAPEGVTPAQTMVGLFRNNAAAFIGGDINQVRQGAVLRIPATPELQAVEAREAAALVGTYTRQWRQARTSTRTAPDAPANRPAALAAASTAPVPRESGGRLEIVPPGGGKTSKAGQQSGIAAGGEGEMLRQELQTTKEALAARDAEVQELKSRLTELERLKADQQKLIALQSTQMNAAQQRTVQATPPAKPPAPATASPLPWIAGALVLLALVAFAWMRRRGPATPAFRVDASRPSIADAFGPEAAGGAKGRPSGIEAGSATAVGLGAVPAAVALAAAQPAHAAAPIDESSREAAAHSFNARPNAESAPGSGPVHASVPAAVPAAVSAPAPVPASVARPAGHTAPAPIPAAHSWQKSAKPPRAAPAPIAATPTWVAPRGTASRASRDDHAALASQVDPASAERLELAQAYLDLGDTANARALLDEVAGSDDATARSVATRMLRTLG